jgi:5-formyltetrahydrofolate cyclo-ligase
MEKEEIRRRIWTLMEERGVARFPMPVTGRIPNFEGAEIAARRLEELDAWSDVKAMKANPDSPQRPARRLALGSGKVIYMAVPRLAQPECFLELDPHWLERPERAATIKGAFALGRPVRPDKVKPIDIVLAGSVAVDRRGGRVGKGGGYSDLEFALGREYGFISEDIPVVTTVHPLQVVEGEIPMHVHDISVDWVLTPERGYRMDPMYRKPGGIYWEILSTDKLEAVPILRELKETAGSGGAP